MYTKDEIEKMNISLSWGLCMKDPGPCDICGGDSSLMYGIFAKDVQLKIPLAVVCFDHDWMRSLPTFWNQLSVEERVNRFNERIMEVCNG